MLRVLVWFVALVVMGAPFDASAQVLLTEGELIKLANKNAPQLRRIEANQQKTESQSWRVRSQYDPQVSAEYTYASSREQAIIQFVPVFQPQKIFNAGITQKNSLGTTLRAGVFSQQISTGDGFITNATQVGMQVGLDIDLWRNFLGRLDKSQLKSAQLSQKIAKLQAGIDKRSFVLDARKIFWTVIANEVSLNLSNELVQTAKAQLNESKRKLREGLGDAGDVARNQAQLQSRETSALFFSYQKEQWLAQLQSVLPGLKNQKVQLNVAEALDVERLGRSCMAEISSQPELNLEYTWYDDIASVLGEQKSHELRLARATDSFDVKLKGQYQASGVDNSHSAALAQLDQRFLNGYQVGLAVSVPISGDLGRSRESQEAATRNQFEAQRERLLLQIHAEHSKIHKSMQLLISASESQRDTIKSLKQSLQRTKRKYKQARVSLNTYILEQDNLFNSELQLIDTKRQILHLLLDYFKVFSKHPCQINLVQGGQS